MYFFSILLGLFFSISEVIAGDSQWNFGHIALENSGSPEAQKVFLQGLAAMHSFEYKEALIDFQEAQKIDPHFALAFWGEAMAYNHAFWKQQDFDAARKAMEKLGKTPQERIAKTKLPLEKDLIRGLDILFSTEIPNKEERDQQYSDYMAQLYDKYSQNLEILSLYALSVLGTTQPNDTTFRKQMKAAGIIDTALGYTPSEKMLNHPGILHYYIHALDDPIHAPLALKAAERYTQVAPDAAHALHMPSHIYLQLGLWDKTKEANRVSYDASVRWVNSRTKNPVDREYHSLYWLMYANLQLGRYAEAKQNVSEILELLKNPACFIEGHWALMSARYMVETQNCFHPFSLEEMKSMGDCYVSDEPQAYSFIYAMGYCAILKKDFTNANVAIKLLEELRTNLMNSVTRTTKIRNEQDKQYRIKLLTISIEELFALIENEKGLPQDALDRLEQVSKIESELPLPNGIPVPVQSSIDLYGRFLLQDKQWAKARDAYLLSLDRMPNRAKSYVGLARALQGLKNHEEANIYMQKALNIWKNADTQFPELEETKIIQKN